MLLYVHTSTVKIKFNQELTDCLTLAIHLYLVLTSVKMALPLYSNEFQSDLGHSEKNLQKTLKPEILLNVEFEMEQLLQNIKTVFSSPHLLFFLLIKLSSYTRWQNKYNNVSKEKRLLFYSNNWCSQLFGMHGGPGGTMKITHDLGCSDLKTARSPTWNVNSDAVWRDSLSSQWGSSQSVSVAYGFALYILHSVKTTEECTLCHKFCNTSHCRMRL